MRLFNYKSKTQEISELKKDIVYLKDMIKQYEKQNQLTKRMVEDITLGSLPIIKYSHILKKYIITYKNKTTRYEIEFSRGDDYGFASKDIKFYTLNGVIVFKKVVFGSRCQDNNFYTINKNDFGMVIETMRVEDEDLLFRIPVDYNTLDTSNK